MASTVKVVGTDLKQVTIKVNPGTYLVDVLEQACQKLKAPSSKFSLKYKQRQLDLSQTFRNSGLVPGAKLELVVRANTPSAINVALQLPSPESNIFPPNGRILDKLPSDLTLWKILRQFESGKSTAGKNLNLTARGVAQTNNGMSAGSGQLYYETPVLVLESRTFSTFVDFQKSLSQLGYNSGSVLIRLSFQKTDKTLVDAMSEIRQYFQEEEAEEKREPIKSAGKQEQVDALEQSVTGSESVADGSVPTAPKETEASAAKQTLLDATAPNSTGEQDHDAMDVDDAPVIPGGRPVTIFSAPTSSTPAAALRQDNEDAFTPDISHAKAHQKLLKSAGENKRLLSDQELEEKAAAEAAKVAAVKSLRIRVRFPDNFAAEWTYGPEDTGARLYADVRGIMASEDAAFKLALPGNRTTIIADGADAKLIQTYRLSANTLLNFMWDDSVPAPVRTRPFLKDTVAGKARQVVVPEVPELEVDEPERGATGLPAQAPKPRNEGEGGFKKPKWLKGLSKK
ncbi:putative UBX domain protein [Xylariomycetidae sp. FL2044]|nr:putative UBX domain protein [Xylariomycetidae sp. FL2044]